MKKISCQFMLFSFCFILFLIGCPNEIYADNNSITMTVEQKDKQIILTLTADTTAHESYQVDVSYDPQMVKTTREQIQNFYGDDFKFKASVDEQNAFVRIVKVGAKSNSTVLCQITFNVIAGGETRFGVSFAELGQVIVTENVINNNNAFKIEVEEPTIPPTASPVTNAPTTVVVTKATRVEKIVVEQTTTGTTITETTTPETTKLELDLKDIFGNPLRISDQVPVATAIPQGYVKKSATLFDQNVDGYVSEEFGLVIYYLENREGQAAFYFLDKDLQDFVNYEELLLAKQRCIILPRYPNMKAPEGFLINDQDVFGKMISAWVADKTYFQKQQQEIETNQEKIPTPAKKSAVTDQMLLMAATNNNLQQTFLLKPEAEQVILIYLLEKDGSKNFYLYDKRQDILEKYDEFERLQALMQAKATVPSLHNAQEKAMTHQNKYKFLLYIVIALAVIAVCVISVILVILRKKRQELEEESGEESFEDEFYQATDFPQPPLNNQVVEPAFLQHSPPEPSQQKEIETVDLLASIDQDNISPFKPVPKNNDEIVKIRRVNLPENKE